MAKRNCLQNSKVIGSNPIPTSTCPVSLMVKRRLYTANSGGSIPSPGTIYRARIRPIPAGRAVVRDNDKRRPEAYASS